MSDKILGIIFDMDGVVVDNHKFHFRAWMEFAKKYNFLLNEDIYRKEFNGKTNADLFVMIFGPLNEEQIKEYSHEKETNYQNLYKSFIKAHDGLIPFLEFLKSEKIKIAIGTSAPKSNVDFTLDTLNLRSYFDVIVDGSEVKKGKPDPEVYLKCSSLLGLPPENCLVFEDSIAGLISGKNAGCKIVGVSTSHSAMELKPTVDQIIKDFTDIQWIKEFILTIR